MIPLSRFFPIALAAFALPGCETLEFSGLASRPEPSVAVAPVLPPPAPGYERSGEVFDGTVSWYSVRTNGGTKTASGEKFKDHGDTAAHLTLPFGTLVEVTNLANDETVVLRINDRGPFKKTRVLDVSIGAAKKLGFDKKGLTQCRIEVLRPVPEEEKEEAEDLESSIADASPEKKDDAVALTEIGNDGES